MRARTADSIFSLGARAETICAQLRAAGYDKSADSMDDALRAIKFAEQNFREEHDRKKDK